MQEVWNGETGRIGVVGEQSFLHKTVYLLCRSEMSINDDKGCCEGTEVGLAHGLRDWRRNTCRSSSVGILLQRLG